jgi:hypothetical protein
MRFGKASGSAVNWLVGGVVASVGGIAISCILLWVVVSNFMGKAFKQVVDNKRLIE